MVAWCQESNGSIPQSQMLQVRKTCSWSAMDLWDSKIWISPHYYPVRQVYMTLCDCQCILCKNVHLNGFKQLLFFLSTSSSFDNREADILKHGRHPDVKLTFQMVVCSSPLCRISWIPAAVLKSRASFIWKRRAASPGRNFTCFCAVLDCTILRKECQRQARLFND